MILVSREGLSNVWCKSYLEVWKWRNNKVEIYKEEKKEILCPECKRGKRKLWWNWGVVA